MPLKPCSVMSISRNETPQALQARQARQEVHSRTATTRT